MDMILAIDMGKNKTVYCCYNPADPRVLDRQGETWPAGNARWTEAALKQLRLQAKPPGQCDDQALWRAASERPGPRSLVAR